MLAVSMELRHLRYFVAVAAEENVSRAALKLHVSQPALSRQIRDLEDELGFALLERDAKSVRLTEAGRVFWDEAESILKRVEAGVGAARAVATGETGELHVGYAPSPTARILPAVLRAFQSAVPKVRVRLHDLAGDEMVERLRAGTLHIAIMVRPSRGAMRGLRFEEIGSDPYRVAVAPGHAFAKRRSVSLREVARESLIGFNRDEYGEYHDSLGQMFKKVGAKARIAEEHDGINSLVAAVEAGHGVALVTESVACLAGPRLKLIPISPAPKPLVIGAAWSGERIFPLAGKFLEHARAVGLSK